VSGGGAKGPGQDLPRLLHRNVALPPTSDPALAAIGEPEMVPREVEEAYARAARRDHERRQREAWCRARGTIVEAVAAFRDEAGRVDPPVLGATRAVLRAARSVDRKLGLR
jgi:hypothetical protein